jgi:hypothetical protein
MDQYKEYKNRSGELVCILFGAKAIPLNQENTDYQEYLKWLAEGNTPLPADTE